MCFGCVLRTPRAVFTAVQLCCKAFCAIVSAGLLRRAPGAVRCWHVCVREPCGCAFAHPRARVCIPCVICLCRRCECVRVHVTNQHAANANLLWAPGHLHTTTRHTHSQKDVLTDLAHTHAPQRTEHNAHITAHRAQRTEHRRTQYSAQRTEHSAQRTEHSAQNTEHKRTQYRAQKSTEHRRTQNSAQRTAHRTQHAAHNQQRTASSAQRTEHRRTQYSAHRRTQYSAFQRDTLPVDWHPSSPQRNSRVPSAHWKMSQNATPQTGHWNGGASSSPNLRLFGCGISACTARLLLRGDCRGGGSDGTNDLPIALPEEACVITSAKMKYC